MDKGDVYRPRKSYSAQMFQSPEQMLGKFSILCKRRLQYVLFDMLNKYFIAQIVENTFIFAQKKNVKTGISDYPSPGEIKSFFKPTPIFY